MILSTNLDASEIYPNIWVGSVPPRGKILAEHGFTHVFLCAAEHQYPSSDFDNVTVFHCPFEDDDSIMPAHIMSMIFLAARGAAEAYKGGGNVLITCRAGQNRSALVAALTLRMLGYPAMIAVESIRARRLQQCLSNTCFMRIALGMNKAVDFYLSEKL